MKTRSLPVISSTFHNFDHIFLLAALQHPLRRSRSHSNYVDVFLKRCTQ